MQQHCPEVVEYIRPASSEEAGLKLPSFGPAPAMDSRMIDEEDVAIYSTAISWDANRAFQAVSIVGLPTFFRTVSRDLEVEQIQAKILDTLIRARPDFLFSEAEQIQLLREAILAVDAILLDAPERWIMPLEWFLSCSSEEGVSYDVVRPRHLRGMEIDGMGVNETPLAVLGGSYGAWVLFLEASTSPRDYDRGRVGDSRLVIAPGTHWKGAYAGEAVEIGVPLSVIELPGQTKISKRRMAAFYSRVRGGKP
jgi:hypothetical protein